MQGEILSLPGKKKKLNSTGSLSDAVLERKNPFALLRGGPGVLRVPRRLHCLRDLHLVAGAPQDPGRAAWFIV